MSVSEDFLKFEVDQILYLQDKLQWMEPLLEFISNQFDPTNAYFVIGPLIAAMTGESLTEMMVVMSFADFMALLIKWASRESRPLWWIRETNLYTDANRPTIRQYPTTCATTAGGPSAHSTIATVILYLYGQWLVDYLEKKTSLDRDTLNCSVFSGISIVLGLTWLSRTYFGSHFFHQCVSGTTLALSVISCVEQEEIRKEIINAGRKRAMAVAFGMIITAGSIYVGMVRYGIDPMWSVRMAFKWCENVDHMRPETTPMYGLVRNFGSMFGIALCAPLKKRLKPSANPWKSVPITVGFITLNSYILSKTPKDMGGWVFLSYVFIASFFHTYSMIALVPKITNWSEGSHPRPPSLEPVFRPRMEVPKLPRISADYSHLEDSVNVPENRSHVEN